MTRTFKLAAIAAATFMATAAFAAPTIDANLELDTKYGNQDRGLSQSGRVEVNVAGKAGGDNGFVAGRGTLLLKKDGTTGVDDMWGQIGTSVADVKFGRFEAADLFPVGKDVYVENDGVNGYRANTLRGRFGSNPVHLALSVNAVPGVGLELGIVETKNAGETKGVRPAVSFNAGPVSVKLGFETSKTNATATAAESKLTGFGGTVGVPLMGGTVNVNAATAKVKVTGAADVKSTSFGLVGVFGAAGVAYIADKTGDAKQNTFYVAYSLPLFATGATITPAASYSKQKNDAANTAAKSGVAVRVNYAF